MKLCDAKILYVDDEPLLLEIFCQWLTAGSPHQISTAADGQEALEMLGDGIYDLVITDVNMPRMNGITLVRSMARLEKRLPSIVFVSGFGNVDEREMYGLGVQAFLSKPTVRETMVETVEHALADRCELWRRPLEMPVRQTLQLEASDFSESALTSGISLGSGGFSVHYARPVAPGKVSFHCHLSDTSTRFTGQGYVRWISKAEETIGIELAYLEESCRTTVLNEMSRKNPQAFIPSL